MLNLEAGTLRDLLDAAYDAAPDPLVWSKRAVQALMTLTSARTGAAFRFTSGYEEDTFRVRSMDAGAAIGNSGAWLSAALGATMHAPREMTGMLLGHTHGSTASSVTRLGARLADTPGWSDCWPGGVVDSMGLVARDPNGDGFVVTVGLDRVSVLNAREERFLGKVATHLGAGARLRRTGHSRRLDDAEAVLTPGGKILHAEKVAQGQRASLDDGRRRRDEARKTTHDADRALEIWKGLIAGRWSLVDHFDTDGKRFLLAMKNTPAVDKRGDLTPRERRVCALVAMGHRDKEVAYMLGLSVASVAAALHRARRKLNVSSRTELARIWRAGA